ncbi:SAM-dependent chlorinase/fluorinase [Flavobacterium sp.]|uniref:SAM hydrolase/SAM-dependent halogenase family protein n=1 Tax=Flavobacterium sp. TaxID=239 RepID=UPI00260836A2|nr:SAM-dependent chlorinase/fluorinase [Flavobacterium sp.]MDD3004940.1 SAM-dependent chlorinase/fluorinase [Flavobacterium sp.]
MSIITLTTDFGLKDHFVGALKGKIMTQLPDVTIIDISHNIDPFNVAEASYIVESAYSSFPKGTVHLIGVDAELNSQNLHIAMQWNDHYFIAADNGILSLLTQRIIPQKIYAINIHDRLHIDASDLDVFITVATHLAKGGLLNVIGKEIQSLKEVTQLQPSIDHNTIKGCVIYIDHFGNVVTNISKKMFVEFGQGRPYEIFFNAKSDRKSKNAIKTIYPKYSNILDNDDFSISNYDGQRLAIFNEAQYLELGIFRSNPNSLGSASSLFGLNYRDSVEIIFK